MKIALLIPHLGQGGVENIALNMARWCIRKQIQTDIVVFHNTGRRANLTPKGARIVEIKPDYIANAIRLWKKNRADVAIKAACMKQFRNDAKSMPNLAKYLKNENPDALIAAPLRANIIAVAAKRLAQAETKIILTERNPPSKVKAKFLLNIARKEYPHAHAVVAVSNGVAQDINQAIGYNIAKTIYNPVVNPDDPIPDIPNHPWANDKSAKLVVTAGRLDKQKDFKTLIRAFAILRHNTNARLVILGDGKLRKALQKLITRLNIQKHAILLGFTNNPRGWFAQADVFALSSKFEGLPGALIQALAEGCEVVATQCPHGPDEILDNGRVGRLVPVADHIALANALKDAIRNPLLTKNEKIKHAQKFSADAAMEKYLKLIQNTS